MDRVAYKLASERKSRIKKRLETFYQDCAIPKGEPRKRTKSRKDREDAKQLHIFRNYVWARETELLVTNGTFYHVAKCQSCGSFVKRGSANVIQTGEVHHRIPRSRCTPEQRYDPNNGVLLCNHLINDCHGKAQRHEIEV